MTHAAKISSVKENRNSLSDHIRKAWGLPEDEYIEQAISELGSVLLDFGFITAWHSLKAESAMKGVELSNEQHHLVVQLEKFSSELLDELLRIQSPRELRDDCRIIGLLHHIQTAGRDLPPNIAELAALPRDAFDNYILTSLISRDHITTIRVIEVLKGSTRLSESYQHYITSYSSPLVHRNLRIASQCKKSISPWREISDAIDSLVEVVSYIHDMQYSDAKNICNQVLAVLPNLQEAKFLNRVIEHYHSSVYDKPDIDPLMLYGSEVLGISWSDVWDKYKNTDNIREYINNIMSMKAFDVSLYNRAQFLTIQCKYQDEMYESLWKEVEALNDNLIRVSQYDVFSLTAFATRLEGLSTMPVNYNKYEDSILNHITFITGLPGPHFSRLRSWLAKSEDVACMYSDQVLKGMAQYVYDKFEEKYPSSIEQLDTDDLLQLRKIYLLHLAFCYGDRQIERIIDIIPSGFKHIGLLSLIFPEAKFIAIHPNLYDHLKFSFMSLFGFDSSHANATMSELVGYAYDYSLIIDRWKKHLGSKLDYVNLDIFKLSDYDDLKNLIIPESANIKLMDIKPTLEMPKRPKVSIENVESKLLEFVDDINEINEKVNMLKGA